MQLEANESQYFIGIGLPKKENAFFSQLKLEFSGVEQLSSPPHITLKPPFFHQNENYLIEKLTAFAKTQDLFEVKLTKVGSFIHRKNATVYLAPEKTFELKKLERALSAAFPWLPPEANFVPHLTLAQRIQHEQVAIVKRQLRDLKLEIALLVKGITLYKKVKTINWATLYSADFNKS